MNTALLAYVLVMLFFFAHIQSKWLVYVWITFYMYVSTICLGSGLGFSLYCMCKFLISVKAANPGNHHHRRQLTTTRQSIDSWIQKADDNLYLGKNSGKNKVVLL